MAGASTLVRRIVGLTAAGDEKSVRVNDDGEIVLASDQLVSTAYPLVLVTDSFTQPASGGGAFAAQDEVSDNATGGSATPLHFVNVVAANGDTGYIVLASLESVSGAATFVTTNAVFRLWLFNAAPTAMFGNDSPFQLDAADKAKRIVFIDFALITEGTGSDTGYGLDDGIRVAFKCDPASRDLWGVIVAKAAYVWTNSQTWDVRLIVELA
jgi:hypothetical protein